MFRNQVFDQEFSEDVQNYIRALEIEARRHREHNISEITISTNDEQPSDVDSGVQSNNNLTGSHPTNEPNSELGDEMAENRLIQRYSCNCEIGSTYIRKLQCVNTCLKNFEIFNFRTTLNIDKSVSVTASTKLYLPQLSLPRFYATFCVQLANATVMFPITIGPMQSARRVP